MEKVGFNYFEIFAKEIKNNIKTEGDTFTDLLDNFIGLKFNVKREGRLAFRPSSYYKCNRQVWYFLKGFPEKINMTSKTHRILGVGTALHEWVQNNILTELNKESNNFTLLTKFEIPSFNKKGITFIDEHNSSPIEIKFLDERFTHLFPISAMVDGAFEFNNKYYIFEFKTMNSTAYSFLKKPLEDHIKQGAIYSLCLEIPNVMFLYLNKSTEDWKAFNIKYDYKSHDWVKQKLNYLENYVEQDILPEREVSKNCSYCPFKKYCDYDKKVI
jgi:CRISPR/Cas system-associated exonuclease Cas4 (RecB family)